MYCKKIFFNKMNYVIFTTQLKNKTYEIIKSNFCIRTHYI